MRQTIKVKAPLNLTEEEGHLFLSKLSYDFSLPQIKELKDVFVTNTGFVLDTEGLLKESHHNLPDQVYKYLDQVSFYYYESKINPENLIRLDDDKTYFLIHHTWLNYYHWVCESIFRLWMIRNQLDAGVLLIPDIHTKTDFVTGSLRPFEIKNIFIIPEGKSLFIKNLCMPELKPIVDSYDYHAVKGVKEFYRKFIKTNSGIDINLGERLYISRKKAQRKRVANEDEVEKVLIKHGFTILYNEDYTFLEQVSIFSHAKFLVSIHGSGLTNMLFMEDNSYVLELHKKKTNNVDWHSSAFWYLSDALGFNYYHQICDPTDVNDDYFKADFIVDAQLLEKNVALMCRTQ
jgi:capsular polysaccharide biosynthesis protein